MRRINVRSPELRFAAAHFATFRGECEPLHGHSYAVGVEVDGELTGDSWVFDFVELRRMVGGVCGALDHAFLLAVESPHLAVAARDGHWEIGFGSRRYVIPEDDVRPLPIDNCTAERLAEWFAGRLAEQLRARGARNLSSLTVTVDESPGQSASFTLSLDSSPAESS